MTALLIFPLTFALGLAYDYTMASNRKDQINGMADAATLGAVTPDMMAQPLATAETRVDGAVPRPDGRTSRALPSPPPTSS